MGAIIWLLAGLLVGVSTDRLLPGYVPGGAKAAVLVGAAGAFVGGLASRLLLGLHADTLVWSVPIAALVAIVWLRAYRALRDP